MNSELALCYYPTQIALVDDNSHFLLALTLHMEKQFSCCTFSDPHAALKFANRGNERKPKVPPNVDFSRLVHNDFEDIIHLTFNQSDSLRKQHDRYQQLSVVVVDYQMPEINGLDFCRQLNNPNIKKVLLTSEISQSQVIDAFNEGIIDYYVCKGKRNFIEDLHDAVARLQHEYFRDLSRQLKTRALEGLDAIFKEPALSKHFFSVCQEYKVREYYFATKPSRYILHTHDEQEISMLIFSVDDINKHVQIMEEENAPKDLIKKVQSGDYLPYFSSSDGYYEPELEQPNNWLLKSHKIQGSQLFYCALFSTSLNCNETVPFTNIVATFH